MPLRTQPAMVDLMTMATRLCVHIHGSDHASGGIFTYCNDAWQTILVITREDD